MNFYERQAAARRSSRWLLLAFTIAVTLVVAVLSWAVLLVLGFDDPRPVAELARDEPALALSTALFWLLIIMGASTWRSLSLRDGGGVVARALGGTRVDRRMLFSCSTRSSLACSASGMSPISSSISVPPSAAWNRPRCCLIAPVNEPFS